MATSQVISQFPPLPNGTGSAITKGTDLIVATDVTQPLPNSPGGTTFKYTQAEVLNFYLQSQGVVTYKAVRVSTTSNLNATYASGSVIGQPGEGATLTNAGTQAILVIDGVTMLVNDRVLVQFQSSNVQNGIYYVASIGSLTTNWILRRATDFDQPTEIIQYATVLVNQGLTYTGILFQETAPWTSLYVIGTNPITFAQYYVASLANILGTANQIVVTQVANTDVISLANPLTFPGEIILGGLLNTNGNSITNSLTSGSIPINTNGAGLVVLNSTQGINGVSNDGTFAADSSTLVPTQAAVKAYVNSTSGGFTFITPPAVANQASNFSATYSNGASGVGATLTQTVAATVVIDGVTLTLNQYALFSGQTAPAQNGLYKLTTLGTGVVQAVFTRATSYDQTTEIIPGSLISVTGGTTYGGSIWMQTNTVTTIGTDPIAFIEFAQPSNAFVTLSTTQTVTGNKTFNSVASITFNPSTQGIVGTVTNDSASAGYVGEYQSNTNAGTVIPVQTPTEVASLSLTAGDWDVEATIEGQSGQLNNAMIVGINTVNNAFATPFSQYNSQLVIQNLTNDNILGGNTTLTTPTVRMSLSTTTTVYTIGQLNNGGGSPTIYAYMRARRVR